MQNSIAITLQNHRKAGYRLKTIVCLIAAMVAMSACGVRDIHAPYVPSDEEIFKLVIRTPLRSVNLPDNVRKIPIALLEIDSLPQELPEGAETRLISFPDELLLESGDKWVFRPSPVVVPITDVLLLGIRFAGLNIESFRTLNEARNAGRQIAIVGVLDTAEASIKKTHVFSAGNESAVQTTCGLSVALVDVRTAEVLWAGPLREVVHHNRAVYLPSAGLSIEAESMSHTGERRAHKIRILMAQCYYHLSVDLSLRLSDALLRMRP